MLAVNPGCRWAIGSWYRPPASVSLDLNRSKCCDKCLKSPTAELRWTFGEDWRKDVFSCPEHLHLMAGQTENDQFPPQTPVILRAYLIKAKSSVPAVNCYLWGVFFLFFFLKLLATFKSTLTLEIEHNRLMNSHLWQILCKQPVNWICDQVFPYQGHIVLASVLYPFLSCELYFATPSITEWNAI